ncbi:TerC family protein [Thiolinea disciformis]|uniref:TerC family protein n=1 Tax=Thiolinea disciformis TaxID=125614 RepID=UPI000368F87B|nr:TerC family protein [Thiolinea disciformis]
MESIGNIGLYGIFFALVAVLLLIDIVAFNKSGQAKVSTKQAAIWSGVWVAVALLFGAGLWMYLKNKVGLELANERALEFFTGYLIEKSLAIDNVFVWLMIFSAFAIPANMQRKVLLYGVLGAIIMRTIMIFAGAWLIQEFHWILYVFGAFLVFTGIKMWRNHGEEVDSEDGWLLRWLRKHLRITEGLEGEKFWVRRDGVLFFTPLMIVLILVEFSDLIFAVDSIPAIFAVTTDPFIVLTANLLAILGLRAMFFLIADLANRMSLLPYALAIILVFIGIKMLLLEVYKIPIAFSLGFVVVTLLTAGIMSWRIDKKAIKTA